MKDFSYAGRRLSDYGYIVAYANTSLSDSVSLGSEIKFETIKNRSTHTNRIIEVDYNEPTSVTFDICKDPCVNENLEFSDAEISHMMSWLNKKRYEKFCPIYDDASYPEIYFKGSFNVSAIYINGNVIGFTLTFVPSAPFGFETERTIYY
jgi:hypothetical protein